MLLEEMLSGIKIPLSVILQNIPAVRENSASIDRVEESCFEMLSVINDTIDFLKLLTDRLQIVSESIDCKKLVTESFGFVEKLIKARKLKWDIHIRADTPSVILGDYHRIQQIFVYFLRTAVTHTNNGAIVTEILRDGEYYIFSIQDTGNGISGDTQKTLDEILKLTALTNPLSYSLLGFAVCHFLCRLMGGKIWYKSSLDLGTKFWFSVRCRT